MRLPKMARSTAPLVALLLVEALLLSACGTDAGSPTGLAPAGASLTQGSSHFNPGKGNKGAPAEGETKSYTFSVNPNIANTLAFGTQVLELPAGAVCAEDSGYGPDSWDLPCETRTSTVKITAKITGTKDGRTLIDFQPAMRFNPAANVQLFMFAKHADADDASRFQILYCASNGTHCVDEARTDASLITRFSARDNEVFRRIKHFSGYVVAERGDGSEGGDVLQ